MEGDLLLAVNGGILSSWEDRSTGGLALSAVSHRCKEEAHEFTRERNPTAHDTNPERQ
jgi:hypothetical protein